MLERLSEPLGQRDRAPVIIPADPVLQRRVVWLLVLLVPLLTWGMYALVQHFQTLGQSDDPQALGQLWGWFTALAVILSVFNLALVSWFVWLAQRIHQTGQFPLPGQRVLRATPLHTGPRARQLVWWLRGLAILLLLPQPYLYSLCWQGFQWARRLL
jgi:hypothetical protein